MPLQAVSEWIDSAVAYRSARFAYFHNIVSLSIALGFLMHVLRCFGLSMVCSLTLLILWLCLPATIAVNEFLSTRTVARNLTIYPRTFRRVACAALCKELYAVTVPLFLFFYLHPQVVITPLRRASLSSYFICLTVIGLLEPMLPGVRHSLRDLSTSDTFADCGRTNAGLPHFGSLGNTE